MTRARAITVINELMILLEQSITESECGDKDAIEAEQDNKDCLEALKQAAEDIVVARCYEDTGLTPEQIMELSESVKKVQEHLDGVITAGQIVDFFVDFYIAQGDDSRVEDAILLTNEEASRYRELKERDTARSPIDIDEDYGFFTCPSCGEAIYASDDFKSHKFCLNCGQRIRWEE